EYNLVSGKVHYRIYFCFLCGGKLPESKRASLFTEPSKREEDEVLKIMSKARSMEQLTKLIGKPDETLKTPDREFHERGESAHKKQHRYLKRWTTLDFIVRE